MNSFGSSLSPKLNPSPTQKFLEEWGEGGARVGDLWDFLVLMQRDDVTGECRKNVGKGEKVVNRVVWWRSGLPPDKCVN